MEIGIEMEVIVSNNKNSRKKLAMMLNNLFKYCWFQLPKNPAVCDTYSLLLL